MRIRKPIERAAASTSLTVGSVIVGLPRFDQQGEARGCGHHVAQQFQPLGCHLGREPIDAGQITARPREACDQDQA